MKRGALLIPRDQLCLFTWRGSTVAGGPRKEAFFINPLKKNTSTGHAWLYTPVTGYAMPCHAMPCHAISISLSSLSVFLAAGSSRPSFSHWEPGLSPPGGLRSHCEEHLGMVLAPCHKPNTTQHRRRTLSRSLISQLALAPAGPPTQSVLSPCLSASQGCASCASQIAPVIHIDISCAGQGQGSRTSVRRLWSPPCNASLPGTYRAWKPWRQCVLGGCPGPGGGGEEGLFTYPPTHPPTQPPLLYHVVLYYVRSTARTLRSGIL